jgi:hypothetical protein
LMASTRKFMAMLRSLFSVKLPRPCQLVGLKVPR